MRTLLARHAAASMLKQLALGDLVGGQSGWSADLDQGTLRFAGGPPHAIQLLGTESYADRTWLWAWANAESELPPGVTQASERLRAIGAQLRVTELTTPQLSLDHVDGHSLAAIATGLLAAAGHYRGPYGSPQPTGAAFFLLTDYPPADQVDASAVRLIRAVEMSISRYELDHRDIVRGLASDMQLPLREDPDVMRMTSALGEELEFRLDPHGRIAKMSTLVRR